MKNIAVLLTAGMLATGCAARATPRPDDVLNESDRIVVMRDYLGRLPAGSRVTAITVDGTRVSGTLLAVDEHRLVVQPQGRLPEPSRALPIASLQRVEPQPAGGNGPVAKAVVIGVVTGAAAFLTMLLVTLAMVD